MLTQESELSLKKIQEGKTLLRLYEQKNHLLRIYNRPELYLALTLCKRSRAAHAQFTDRQTGGKQGEAICWDALGGHDRASTGT